MGISRKTGSRILAVGLGFLTALVLLEAGLRVASHFASERRFELDTRVPPGATAILFAGDSHTFGLWVNAEDSLPQRTAQVLRECGVKDPFPINLGRSGAPSWVAVDEVEEYAGADPPRAVVFRAGVNNAFCEHPNDASLWDGLRVVKLARISLYNLRGPRVLPESRTARVGYRRDELDRGTPTIAEDARPRFGPLTAAELESQLRSDLTRLAAWTRRRGCPLFVIGYLDIHGHHVNVSDVLEKVSAERALPFVNLRPTALAAEKVGPREEFLLADGHPRRMGYGMEALVLARSLVDAGVVAGSRPADPIDWYARARIDKPVRRRVKSVRLECSTVEEVLHLTVTTEPKRMGWIVIGRAARDKRIPGFDIPIDLDDSSALALRCNLTFETDERGVARVAVRRQDLPKSAAPLVCAALVGDSPHESADLVFSKVLLVDGGQEAPRQVEIDTGFQAK